MILGRNLSTVLFHNAVADAQTQAGSLAYDFGRIERIENMFWIIQPRPRIVKLADHVAVVAIYTDAQQPAASAIEHGIGGIVDDVEIDLLELMRIGNHRRQHGIEVAI